VKILVACEESQEVCKAFRKLGHEAYSCDILPCSGGHPEWHIQDDVLKHLLSLHFIRQHDLVQPKLHNRHSARNMKVYTITRDGAFYLFNELNEQRLADETKDNLR